MDVTLIGNYPNDEHESMTRYAEMLKALLAENGGRVEIIRPEPVLGRLKRSSRGLGKWLGYIDKYILFPMALRRHIRRRKALQLVEGPFLVHVCDQANAIYTRWLKDVPHLVTCHDVMAIQSARGLIPGQKTGWTGRLLQGWILSGLRNAACVICVTQETRQDLLSLAPELENRSETIELPLNYPYAPMPKEQALAQMAESNLGAFFRPGKDRYLFHVGGNQWYKNREGVIHMYSRLCSSFPDLVQAASLKLVMAGKPPTPAMLLLADKEKLSEKITFLTEVSNEQLCAFYSQAEALVYPSLKEGFGWPIIEAQACGCPIITSNRAPMNRLAGPVALLADPENQSDFAARMVQILSEEPILRQKRREEALRYSRNFDPQIFFTQMMATYKKALLEPVKNLNSY